MRLIFSREGRSIHLRDGLLQSLLNRVCDTESTQGRSLHFILVNLIFKCPFCELKLRDSLILKDSYSRET